MNNAEFQLQVLGDPRLALHATSALPAWLWSTDGTRILWANPVGARAFGAANGAALALKIFGPADPHRRQVAQLGSRLPQNGAVRLERLRGFGASPGMLATCGCSRLAFPDGSHGILVTSANASGRMMPLVERLQRLVEGIDRPIAAFARDGMFVGASDAARPLLGFRDLAEAGLDAARADALTQGRVETPVGIGHMVLQRVGYGADIGLVALIAPHARPAAPLMPEAGLPEPDARAVAAVTEPPAAPAVDEPFASYQQPAQSGEAPAEFALFDAFEEPPAQAVAESLAQQEPSEPDIPNAEAAHAETSYAETQAVDATPPVESSHAEISEPTVTPEIEAQPHEPSPYIEAVADEPAATPIEEQPPASSSVEEPPPRPAVEISAPAIASVPVKVPSWLDEPLPNTRRLPLRFMWQMDHESRFSLGSDEFTRLIGARTAAGFGRLWSDIATAFGLDPDGRVMKAFATRDTWSGITLNWPVDGGGRLPIELSGLPVFDRARSFAGYRGFGVCRDLDGLARLAALRRCEFFGAPLAPQALSADVVQAGPASDAPGEDLPLKDASAQHTFVQDLPTEDLPSEDPPVEHLPTDDLPAEDTEYLSQETLLQENLPQEILTGEEPAAADVPGEPGVASAPPAELHEPMASETSHQTDLETPVETPVEMPAETPKNVLPFRPIGDAKPPSLTPVENSAFNELARQLSARLETEMGADNTPPAIEIDETVVEPTASSEPQQPASELASELESEPPVGEKPDWLARPEPPARGEARRDKALLDLVPVGVLIYRLDRLLYANPAFFEQMGYASLHALEEAGGLDALYVEPGVSNASSTSDTGTPVTISASQPDGEHTPPQAVDAHLYTISWDGDSALALIFSGPRSEGAAIAAAIADATPVAEPSAVGQADAEELGAILDTTAEGIVMFDAEGNINSANRSAEALFGYDGAELVRRNLADLFAPESQHAVFDYLASIKSGSVESLLDHGLDALGRVAKGGLIPLAMTMGRTRADGPNFFAVFRDLTPIKNTESELREARRLTDRAATAKSDVLARISHEVRTPLNAIIGFAEVMIGERFGALGNERYAEYMKDIRASGERVIAIINDLLDLSRIETGKLDLSFTHQNLNELVESCVAVMQPQANRERIIIRTSLAHMLPPVVADAHALRQIALNLIGNSIHLANAGGQVIVSTALSDFGEVVLRVRDTGQGLNDNEVAAALEPFRTPAPSDQSSDNSPVNLSLTKALVEANRAKFQIKTGGRSGTLIEVVFSHATVKA
jgi:PAS domain S-box-containing protein